MTEAIERIKAAINDTYDVDYGGYLLYLDEIARAALLAIREPSKAQIDAFVACALQVSISSEFTWNDYARLQWTGMIDAALAEHAPPT